MKSVDRLVKITLRRWLEPLAQKKGRSWKDLKELRYAIRERLINGLYDILSEEKVVRVDEAVKDAYEQSLGPDIEEVFDHFEVEDYDRDSVPEICDNCISKMTVELTRIVEDYKRQDARLYEQQFKQQFKQMT